MGKDMQKEEITMKIWIKGIAALLAVILAFSGLLSGSSVILASDTTLSTFPQEPTAPTIVPTTVPTTAPATQPSVQATITPTTVPVTQATAIPTLQPTTAPAAGPAPSIPATEVTTQATTEATAEVTTEPPTEVTTKVTAEATTQTTAIPTQTTVPAPTQSPTAAPEENITAKNAFVYTCSDNSFPYIVGQLDAKLYPASITKLFTAYVVLKYLDPAREITAGDILDAVPSDSSKIWLVKGDILTVEQLLYGTLMCSGGDAARVLAADAGRVIANNPTLPDADSIAVFVAEMNRQAASLGMSGTHFVNPDGYHDDNHYSCMADIVTLGKLCLDTPLIRQITATTSITNPLSDKSELWKNTNLLLQPDSKYYCDNAIGLKTGNTLAAGSCLLSAFEVTGCYALIGVFGCPDYTSRFDATIELYDSHLR